MSGAVPHVRGNREIKGEGQRETPTQIERAGRENGGEIHQKVYLPDVPHLVLMASRGAHLYAFTPYVCREKQG